MVRAPGSWSKGRSESPRERRENSFFQGQLSVLTLISVSFPHPCYCSSTYTIRVILPNVQVTVKHTCTLCIIKWSDPVKWALLYSVHRTCAETAAVSHGTSNVTTKQCFQYTTSMEINKKRYKKYKQNKRKKNTVTHSESHVTWAQWVCSRAADNTI